MVGRRDSEVTDPTIPKLDVEVEEVTDPLVVNDLLDGRYVLVRQIAKGGMSVVYLAHHVALGRPVALKVLRPPPEVRGRYDFGAWFKAEARTLASFHHPNVVTPHDFGPLGRDGYFLAMEYVAGPSLAAELKRTGPMTPERTVRCLVQVARALRYAHQRGVIHCDVKPSNVLLGEDGDGRQVVKVIDFGIAEVERAGGRAGDSPLLGSPQAMAPEQIVGDPATPATDVYGMGVLIVRCLTGRAPFRGATARETLQMHLTTAPPTLAELRPSLAPMPAMEAIVARCLQKVPADRFPSMDELLLALLDAVPSEIPDDERTGSLALDPTMAHLRAALATQPPAPAPARSIPWVASGLALGLIAAAVGVAWFLSMPVPSSATPETPAIAAPRTPPPAATPSPTPAAETPPPPAEVAGSPDPEPEPELEPAAPVKPAAAKTSPPPSKEAPKSQRADPMTEGDKPPPSKKDDPPPPDGKVPDGYMDMPEF